MFLLFPRRLLAASIALLLAAACSRETAPEAARAAATPAPAKPRTLTRVTTNTGMASLGSAPLMIAAEEGFFRDEGIDLVFEKIDANSSLLAASTGKLDVLSDPLRSGLFNVMLKGAPLQIVADRGHSEPGPCSPQSFAAPLPMAARIAASGFRGEKFVVIRGGTTEYLIDRLLQKHGLTRADVGFAQTVPQGDQVSQQLDAVRLMVEPNLSNVVTKGLMKEVATAEEVAPGHQSSVLVYGKRLSQDDPELGRRFMRAYLRGVRRYGEGKTARNVDIIARATALPADIIRRSCWPHIAADGRVNTAAMEEFLRWTLENHYLDAPVPVTRWWNGSFAEAASRQ